MSRFQRYAIYWVPKPGSPLAGLGECWFANAAACAEISGADTLGLPSELARRATAAPAHYGIHATLKAPFRLREDVTENDIGDALDAFCAVRRPAIGGPLTLTRFQGYLGLVLAHSRAGIDWLADQCVVMFDRFRAPLHDGDRGRREITQMTPAEAAYFETFGYPYILSAFLFHVSLAGPLGGAELEQVEEALRPRVSPFEQDAMQVESLCLLGEPADGGAFEIISRHSFRQASSS